MSFFVTAFDHQPPFFVTRWTGCVTLAALRDRVRTEFVGTSTCTHLNDTLRAIADLDALIGLDEV